MHNVALPLGGGQEVLLASTPVGAIFSTQVAPFWALTLVPFCVRISNTCKA